MDVSHLTEEEIDKALSGRTNLQALDDYFGPELRRELSRLAEATPPDRPETRASGIRKVYILPGIMGSKLSVQTPQGLDLVWLDFGDLYQGGIAKLAFDGTPGNVVASGVLWSAYLRMKYRLRWEGFDVAFLPFDWRFGIDELGRRAAETIRSGGEPAALVCHSMGGLVARKVATLLGPDEVPRIVTIGTPNLGSYSPVEVMRVVHDYVLKLGRITKGMGPKVVVEKYLSHFPGLLEMMPSPARRDEAYFDATWWPAGGVVPQAGLLAAALQAQTDLPAPDKRFIQIVGYGQDTITGARKTDDDLIFTRSDQGDGTVPRDLAEMGDPAQRYYFAGVHGWLCNQVPVIHGTADILRRQTTRRLETAPSRAAGPTREIAASELERQRKQDLPATAEEARDRFREDQIMGAFATRGDVDFPADDPLDMTPEQVPGAPRRTFSYVKSSAPRRRLNVDLLRGNILHAASGAFVIGVFQGVPTLGGAAGAIDRALGGALSEMVVDGQITGRLGEVTFLPTPSYLLRTPHVIVVGLGPIGKAERLTAAVQIAGRNLTRALCVSKITSFATVLWAAGTGIDGDAIFRALFDGMFEALARWDEDQLFSRITVCEMNGDRYDDLERCLSQIFARFQVENCEIVLNLDVLEATPQERGLVYAQPRTDRMPDSFTALGEVLGEPGQECLKLEVSFARGNTQSTYGDDHLAAVTPSQVKLPLAHLDDLVGRLKKAGSAAQLKTLSDELRNLIFDDTMQDKLHLDPAGGLGVTNNPWASRIPWELLHADGQPIALNGGVNRRYLNTAGAVSRSRGARTRQRGERALRLFLVANPTNDLPGALKEGQMIAGLAGDGLKQMELLPRGGLLGNAATKDQLTHWLSDSDAAIDVFHYAGHAFFDPNDRAHSGLVLAGREYLFGSDVAGLVSLPRLVFLNACESGRVRRSDPNDRALEDVSAPEMVERMTGLAEAFMLGGVSHLIGTIWPVGDAAAEIFARTFYGSVESEDLGTSVTSARCKLAKQEGATATAWVNYMHYGEPRSRL